jgi:putative chitinase
MIAYNQLLWVINPVPANSRIEELYPWFERTFSEFGINTDSQQAAWIAQSAYETGRYQWLEELASGEAYEGRLDLGNTEYGDGARYKGRGVFQLTGRTNVGNYSEYAWGDRRVLLNEPWRLCEPEEATRSAGWFWMVNHCNYLLDNFGFRAVTKKINGGYNGDLARQEFYGRALRAAAVV